MMQQRETGRYGAVKNAFILGEYGTPPLPEMVVDQILDSARYWNWVGAETRESSVVSNGRRPYLSVEVPIECRQVKMVAMECESHDQGWSSYPSDRGTRNNSWTWGDLSVQSCEGDEVMKEDRVYTNVHACRNWELHKREYGERDPLSRELGPGRKLVLSINAAFPGWENHVKYSKLTVYFI